ncbi:MAG TPA: THUMP domain-containing protein [Anaeromyxobacteraceae bacterium]|nr:THUMP domain-containing protein [Anaeromyxobacteraceae bacterium]
MRDWNVLATAREGGFARARRLLAGLGEVAETRFYNVLLARVPDPRGLLSHLAEQAGADPASVAFLARVAPADRTFTFQTAGEFLDRAREAVLALAPSLAGRSFHVRLRRRGFRGALHAQEAEKALADAILEALQAGGRPGRVAFDDADAVVALETVGSQAGVALWTREDLARWPLLRPG